MENPFAIAASIWSFMASICWGDMLLKSMLPIPAALFDALLELPMIKAACMPACWCPGIAQYTV